MSKQLAKQLGTCLTEVELVIKTMQPVPLSHFGKELGAAFEKSRVPAASSRGTATAQAQDGRCVAAGSAAQQERPSTATGAQPSYHEPEAAAVAAAAAAADRMAQLLMVPITAPSCLRASPL